MAKKNTGYIKVSRDLLHSSIWDTDERLTIREIWLDLNLRASYSEQKKVNGNHQFTLHRGQIYASLRQFGYWWNMDKDTARQKLKLLQEMGLIWLDTKSHKQTLVTLVKYGLEQDKNGLSFDSTSDSSSDDTSDDVSDVTSDAMPDIYKNGKECIKNEERMKKKEPSAFVDY